MTHYTVTMTGPEHGPYSNRRFRPAEQDVLAMDAVEWCKQHGLTSKRWHGPHGLAAFAAATLSRRKLADLDVVAPVVPAPFSDADVRRVANKHCRTFFRGDSEKAELGRAACCESIVEAIKELQQCERSGTGFTSTGVSDAEPRTMATPSVGSMYLTQTAPFDTLWPVR